MAIKYYAVKVGRTAGIYKTWAECKEQVDKYKGAIYKSFPTREEAEAYFAGNEICRRAEDDRPENVVEMYVDGSFNGENYSWAFVAYKGGTLIHSASGVGEDKEAASMRNVAGELAAAVQAIEWANRQGIEAVVLHHDYIGIAAWARGEWKTNNRFTQAYAAFVKPYLQLVSFNKVAGHTGVEGNELADKLAGEALGLKK